MRAYVNTDINEWTHSCFTHCAVRRFFSLLSQTLVEYPYTCVCMYVCVCVPDVKISGNIYKCFCLNNICF